MSPSLTVVVTPDSFKGSATAAEVAAAIGGGWSEARPADTVMLRPMADGGEGTIDAFALAAPGAVRIPVTVTGPDDRPVDAEWLWLPPADAERHSEGSARGGTAVVELANTSGITLLGELRPMDAHTRGFGEAICAALDHGVDQLLLAIGGSSSTDGGVGALTALGARFLDAAGQPIADGATGLRDLHSVDLAALRTLPQGGAEVITDVTNPLIGDRGAAAVFGPQKGADAATVADLEDALVVLERVLSVPGAHTPGAGAAGGTGFGLALWGASIRPGAVAVGEAMGLPAEIELADVVITGEGRFDGQSADGKVPSYVLGLARAADAFALLVAGSVDADPDDFAAWVSLTELAGSTAAAIENPVPFLWAAGRALATGAANQTTSSTD
ncbi:glycerate kinase [Subtercola sp. PAMC28395]|uniref:glycerate kinase n=1 Tax=Subtercola sp. PAMC28395 TaxID=2846775 RepID=UPI001C0AA738|nr:glycerate kinase [Subtercola sp. PAMC28395]QWT24825.1 glycerate kinase [Subtercola sp. PAMC28395]